MNIAMIDDNPTVLMINEAMLKKEGAIQNGDVLDKFSSGAAFMEAVHEKGVEFYDVVVMDHDLGDKETRGFDVLVQLNKNGFKGKAVLLTADESMLIGLKTKLATDIEYLIKNQGAIPALSKIINQGRKQ